jgi:CHAT domain-containing protein
MDGSRLAFVIRSVQRAIHWLKENSDALQDPRDLAISIRALLAAEKNPHSHLLQRLTSALARQQSTNGSWSDELWDTVWAVRALHDVGIGQSAPAFDAALRFIIGTQDRISGTWYEEPFETILVLELLASVAPDMFMRLGTRPLEWIASLQNAEGCIIGIRYTGMAASLFTKVKELELGQYNSTLASGLAFIQTDLSRKEIWTSAAWSNYYPFQALLDNRPEIDEACIDKALDWYLSSQEKSGRWIQVSQIHDTAMSIIALSNLLRAPLVDLSDPRIGILNASRENGSIRVSFQGPGSGAITPAEKMKISDEVRADLSQNQQLMVSALGKLRSAAPVDRSLEPAKGLALKLERARKYAYGHLVPPKIQSLLESCPADHLRLDIDERLIDLPWELIHDGTDFLCLRYATGRRLISDQSFATPKRSPSSASQTKVLVVADPTGDLPAAREEGRLVAELLERKCGMRVDGPTSNISKRDFLLCLRDYDVVHFAGHASHDADSPDESYLALSDGEIQAFEIARFIANRSPALVFLNACWSAEELRDPKSYSPMMRGLGRTFLFAGVSAFIGYLVPVPDQSATRFALRVYESLAQGQTIGEAVRLGRIAIRQVCEERDLTWSAALLYGDPTHRVVIHSAQEDSV